MRRGTARLVLLLLLTGCREAQPAMSYPPHRVSVAELDQYQRGVKEEIAMVQRQLRRLTDTATTGVGFVGKLSGRVGATEGARAAGLSFEAYQGLVSEVDSMLVARDTLTQSPEFASRAVRLDSLRTELIVLRSRLDAEASTITTDNP